MPAPSKTAAELLAECCKAAEEHCKLKCEEKEHKDAELVELKANAKCKTDEKAVQKKAQEEKEEEECKAGGLEKSVEKKQKLACKQRGDKLVELLVKCKRCKKNGKKCMMPMKNAQACNSCHNLQKHKVAKVDSDNKAGPSKRSNTMTRGSNPGISEAMRWQELPLAHLRNGQMEFVSHDETVEEQSGGESEAKMKSMEEDLEKVNKKLWKRAEEMGKQVRCRRVSRRIVKDEGEEDQGPVAGGSGTRHSDDKEDKGKGNEESEKEKGDRMEDIEESQTQKE
ncbi:hypothetical protein BDQ12DRAFT_669801 [Crucibulum laeve]|uniref:Uncharacterized protein n=1 Tax=Crucibulum laeve TaxID=68775 RepID=A0A5C3LN17_9AGAR|nr:hypothetical protein BDQ12DRAFT_669801 [Crucibulum laeve]